MNTRKNRGYKLIRGNYVPIVEHNSSFFATLKKH